MALQLYFHPLSSFCQKALVALYENETPFEGHVVDLMDEAVRARFQRLWPMGKMPVLRDDARDRIVPEATIVIEYLAAYYPGKTALVPRDAELAWQTRMRDRFYDLYVNEPMGKIVTDRLRPDGRHDTFGVEQAKAVLTTAYNVIEAEMRTRTWAVGEIFTMADCAAAPALYYANLVLPLDGHPKVAAYLGRLMERPSFARAVAEAEPYRAMFPAK
ncbi:MAG TPA: glutathione S-transferase family protein [Labilithrix sp.]|nr:glutathione S-transferase family protein [Labilithrix sp.]